MHFCGILMMLRTTYQQQPLQKKNDCDDGGAFTVFQELMHSWVGYKLVKVLLIFGLSPKIHNDLENWSPDLFHLFSYMGDKQQDPKIKKELIVS
jgi:hypothetical protein